jgi:hypothetical protein
VPDFLRHEILGIGQRHHERCQRRDERVCRSPPRPHNAFASWKVTAMLTIDGALEEAQRRSLSPPQSTGTRAAKKQGEYRASDSTRSGLLAWYQA